MEYLDMPQSHCCEDFDEFSTMYQLLPLLVACISLVTGWLRFGNLLESKKILT